MQVVLQVAEGSHAGRRIWLRGRQTAEVGRDDTLDLSVPDDDQLAESHFLVVCDGRTVHVAPRPDAKVKVNGDDVDKRRDLDDGDVIAAGQSTFSIRIQGAPPKAAPLPPAAGPAAAAAPKLPAAPVPARKRPVDPVLLAGERSFRQALERLDGIPDREERPEVLHSTALLCKSLAEIMKVQDRGEEAAPYEAKAQKLLEREDVKAFMKRSH